MSEREPSEKSIEWLKSQLFKYFSFFENPQIDPSTYYSKGYSWISYGALLYAHAAAIRGSGAYPIGASHLISSHQKLKLKMASPNAPARAWGRPSEQRQEPKAEIPWQVWEDAVFDEMESKAAMPNKGWEWFDISFHVEDLLELWPVPNFYAMGREIDVTEGSLAEIEFTEAVTLIGIGKAILSSELSHALFNETGGLDIPAEVSEAAEMLLSAARRGELQIFGNPSDGLGGLLEPKLTGGNQMLPVTAFGPDRTVQFSSNSLNPRIGPNVWEPEFSNLTILVADLHRVMRAHGGNPLPVSNPTSQITSVKRGRTAISLQSAQNVMLECYGVIGKPDNETWDSLTTALNARLKAKNLPIVSQATVRRACEKQSN